MDPSEKPTIGLFATADRLERALVDAAVGALEGAGFGVKVASNLDKQWGGSSAGTPEERAWGLMELVSDHDVSALLAVKGGYGSIQLADLIDWPKMAISGKPVIGYSDLTYVLNGLVGCGLEAWHGPMLKDIALEPGRADVVTLLDALKAGRLDISPAVYAHSQALIEGQAEGTLWGGNLAVLSSMTGSPWELSGMAEHVLFFEEVGERIHKLDRWLHQMKHAGLFEGLRGVLVGRMTHIDDSETSPYGFGVEDVLRQVFGPMGVPVVTGLACGHGGTNFPLPLGRRVRIHATKQGVTIA